MVSVGRMASGLLRLSRESTRGLMRYVLVFVLALVAFGITLWVSGKDPLKAYLDILNYTLGNSYGLSEVVVRMIPLMLTAVAVALPFRIGLINLGGEGQLYMGAWLATWGALTLSSLPQPVLLPVMILLGFVGGGFLGVIPGFLRAKGWVSETISTLLLYYVAPLLVSFSVFGPWRSPESSFYPQTHGFVDAARLPTFAGTRVHLGLALALVAVVLYWFLMAKTRWGLEMRAIGGNPEAARRTGIPVGRYIVLVLFVGGGIAGLAGMAEVSGVMGRLRPGISPGYGWAGFLTSWLAGGNPLGILIMAFLLAVLTSGGDILQITQGVPYAVVNILMALILFVVLGRPAARGKAS